MKLIIKKPKNILLFLLLFLYIYNIGFVFFPGFLKSRMLIGIIGFFYSIKCQFFNKKIFSVFILYFVFIVFTLFIIILNFFKGFDVWFIQHLFLSILYLFGAYFICHFYSRKVLFTTFIYIIVLSILIHNVTAFIGMLTHGIVQDFIFSIQKLDGRIFYEMKDGYSRAVGLGIGNLFLGGVISGIGIILSFFLYKVKYFSTIKLLFIVVIIFFTGIFIARTTVIGFIGLLLLIFDFKKDFKRVIRMFFILTLSIITFFLSIISFLEDKINLKWAFEAFFSYQKGDLHTGSTNELKEMYIFPEKFTTWLYGDAKMLADDGIRYYMNTDVGYLRLLFFGGVFFVIFFYVVQFLMSYLIIKRDEKVKWLVVIINIYSLILSFKGFTELNYMLFLFLAFLINKKHEKSTSVTQFI